MDQALVIAPNFGTIIWIPIVLTFWFLLLRFIIRWGSRQGKRTRWRQDK